MHRVFHATVVGSLLSIAAVQTVTAQVMVGAQNTVQSNNFPFGSSVGFNEFQQIYSSTLFSGPINIGAISIFNTRASGNFQVGTFNLFLSNTSASPTAPSTPANNIGAGTQQLFATVTYGANTAAPTIVAFSGTP